MNDDVKQKASERNVRLWQIAYSLGITDSSFSRRLRKELPCDEKERIFAIIDQLAESKSEEAAHG